MKKTLFIVGMCNVILACTSTHPSTIDLNLIVTQPVNNTEGKQSVCDLSRFINLDVSTIDKNQYRINKDVSGYVKALEAHQDKLTSENLSLLRELLRCHSL